MRKPKSIRVLLKRPGKPFKTVYFDFSKENILEYFGTYSLEDVYSMKCLLCKTAYVMNTFNSDKRNCDVFHYPFSGPLLFVGEKQDGTLTDIIDSDIDVIKYWTLSPSENTKKKRVQGGKWLWEL